MKGSRVAEDILTLRQLQTMEKIGESHFGNTFVVGLPEGLTPLVAKR